MKRTILEFLSNGENNCKYEMHRRPLHQHELEELAALVGLKLEPQCTSKCQNSNCNKVSGKENSNDINLPIKHVIFNEDRTIIVWKDGTKTMVKCSDGDVYSKEGGFAIAICEALIGKQKFKNLFNKAPF